MEQGMLFDMAHGSFTDGPGVRTVVFFKGCNLKCKWCHNPESKSAASQMIFYENKCTGCGLCKEVCPNKGESCDLCGVCTRYCPSSAKKICGKMRTAEEVMQEIIKDEMFYKKSNGGVTFSGGECMLQIDFLKTLLKECRKAGIHTAVDTAGNVTWENFLKILPYTDMFLYDVKCFTKELHTEGTGVGNERILENLKRLSEHFEGDIIIRIPIIPGFNTDDDELCKMSEFLKNIKCKDIELLPYHRLGENKYAAIHEEVTTYSVPSKEETERMEMKFLEAVNRHKLQ